MTPSRLVENMAETIRRLRGDGATKAAQIADLKGELKAANHDIDLMLDISDDQKKRLAALAGVAEAMLAEIHYNRGCDAKCEAIYHAALAHSAIIPRVKEGV